MQPIRTTESNHVYRGDDREVADLYCEVDTDGGGNQISVSSVWELSREDRLAVIEGANIKLTMFTRRAVVPVYLQTTTEERLDA